MWIQFFKMKLFTVFYNIYIYKNPIEFLVIFTCYTEFSPTSELADFTYAIPQFINVEYSKKKKEDIYRQKIFFSYVFLKTWCQLLKYIFNDKGNVKKLTHIICNSFNDTRTKSEIINLNKREIKVFIYYNLII